MVEGEQGELLDFSDRMERSPHIIIYKSDEPGLKLDVRLEGEIVWLTQQQMADLYQTTRRTNISLHIKNILTEGELTS